MYIKYCIKDNEINDPDSKLKTPLMTSIKLFLEGNLNNGY